MEIKTTPLPKRLYRLQNRLAIAFALLGILASVVAGFTVYLALRDQLIKSLQERLKDMASIAALQVDGDTLARLTDPSQEGSPEYNRVKQTLQHIRDAGTKIRFVYTMRLVGDQVAFIVDAETDPEQVSHLGDIYDSIDPAVKEMVSNLNSPGVDKKFYSDEWGTTISGYAPIYTSSGQREAVLGMDIDVTDALARERLVLWSVFIVILVLIPIVALVGWLLGRRIAGPVVALAQGAARISAGDWDHRIQAKTSGELAVLVGAVNKMAEGLASTIHGLEVQVAKRTKEIEEHSSYLEAAVQVSSAVVSVLDAERLAVQVVELIRQYFGLYYVGLFLVDETNTWAVLRAGTGEIGRILLDRNHKIKIGEGMVGWTIANATTRVAMEVEQDPVRLSIPELSKTRSEAALPLRSRGRILGAITVQSHQPEAFGEQSIAVLQSLSDQVAVALDNAQLFAESQRSIVHLQQASQQLTQSAWINFLRSQPTIGYYANDQGARPIRQLPTGVTYEAFQGPENGVVQDPSELILPIKVRGQEFGTIRAHRPEGSPEWNEQDIAFVQEIIEQLGVALENARLYSTTQRSAERERVLGEISSRVRASTNVNVILQTALQQLTEALRVPKGSIQLRTVDGENLDER